MSHPSLPRGCAAGAALALAGLAFLTPSHPAQAGDDWAPGRYLSQSLARVMTGVRGVTEKTSYGLDDGSNCFMGALLKAGSQVVTSMPLQAGETYVFLGGGDEDTKDLDLYLEDANGKIVARDVEKDAIPVVEFRPKETGKYRVVLKLTESADQSSFCTYATLRAGGFDVPGRNLDIAAARLLALCRAVAKKTGGAGFLNTEGEWALAGTILKQDESLTLSGIDLPEGKHALVAVGDTQAQNIDLTLFAENKQLGEDTEDDPTPVILYEGSGLVSLKISNVKSGGPSLTLAAVLNTK